jgi:hypothetical protein
MKNKAQRSKHAKGYFIGPFLLKRQRKCRQMFLPRSSSKWRHMKNMDFFAANARKIIVGLSFLLL